MRGPDETGPPQADRDGQGRAASGHAEVAPRRWVGTARVPRGTNVVTTRSYCTAPRAVTKVAEAGSPTERLRAVIGEDDGAVDELGERARMARTYLEVAAQTALAETDEGRNVAAGNAVLAAIAAADALCCLRLGRHVRGPGHQEATSRLRSIRPDGPSQAKDLTTVLGVKDSAHYGTVFVSPTVLRSTLRAATRLVSAAETAVDNTPS